MKTNQRFAWIAAAGGACALLLVGLGLGIWGGANGKEGGAPVTETAVQEKYRNPMTLDEEWPDYGIGDPFVMRYNGVYYLYCSTKDGRAGIKSWSSTDLAHWKYEGLVADDPLTTGAYAPEVVYWNGYFYMNTSPAGNGHYVLRAERPTGPFTVQTDNLGLSIDGSVFIDDDGQWTFTHAGGGGIVGHRMTSPTEIDPVGKTLNAFMGHWTEGSMIIERDGLYYLTYTGNHVFSKGYRINYAVAEDSPLGEYRVPDNNPMLIRTAPDFNGLGHSSTVLGPDLDSYYLVYHNLVGRSAEGPPVRQMNIDRLVFNGSKMAVSGPTLQEQPVPNPPAFAYRPGAGDEGAKWEIGKSGDATRWLSVPATPQPRFTAEYNFVATPPGGGGTDFEVLFAYRDDRNYDYVRLDTKSKALSLHRIEDGQDRALAAAELPSSFDFGKLHTIRVAAANPGISVVFDGMTKIRLPETPTFGGKIGYAFAGGQPGIEATFFSGEAGGSGDFDAAKSVPGTVEAVHYMEGKGRGYQVAHPDGKAAFRPQDGVPIVREEDGSYSAQLANRKDWLIYRLNVGEAGTYNVDAVLKAADGDAELEIRIGKESSRIVLRSDDEPGWRKRTLATLTLQPGIQTMQIKLLKGKVDLRYFDLYRTLESPANVPDALKEVSVVDDLHGDWSSVADGYFTPMEGNDARMFVGSDGWTDYEVSLDLTSSQDEPLYEGALMFRVTNESYFPDQVKDAFQGYELAFRNGRAVLRKVNYERVDELESANLETPTGQTTKVRVAVKGGRIEVYANDAKEPLMATEDSDAYLHGRVGIRSSDPAWTFAHVSVAFP
ncbi:family 43 glycosylhydrolase [Cohnella sp. REN36]|uniref:family 43 glycosylhydrolase n=1 Tax=Cohnella sp. REN36 TaxID=2887347 RepID=UPI001D143B7C|nr:family 43 glycosylhydrolase [Cohnella sp. REN36]MCC3373720.1 family 43 glycosylhydrolase [Cohnella sp. REN36]